jgi:hypothetical protein
MKITCEEATGGGPWLARDIQRVATRRHQVNDNSTSIASCSNIEGGHVRGESLEPSEAVALPKEIPTRECDEAETWLMSSWFQALITPLTTPRALSSAWLEGSTSSSGEGADTQTRSSVLEGEGDREDQDERNDAMVIDDSRVSPHQHLQYLRKRDGEKETCVSSCESSQALTKCQRMGQDVNLPRARHKNACKAEAFDTYEWIMKVGETIDDGAVRPVTKPVRGSPKARFEEALERARVSLALADKDQNNTLSPAKTSTSHYTELQGDESEREDGARAHEVHLVCTLHEFEGV